MHLYSFNTVVRGFMTEDGVNTKWNNAIAHVWTICMQIYSQSVPNTETSLASLLLEHSLAAWSSSYPSKWSSTIHTNDYSEVFYLSMASIAKNL